VQTEDFLTDNSLVRGIYGEDGVHFMVVYD
jgi:hypothetical protein